jgi:hypothetical protein
MKHKPMKNVPVNTRKSPRYHTTVLARTEEESAMRESRGNVSAGGFCFESDRELEPGKVVELLVRLPGAGFWLSAKGVVLGCIQYEGSVGVRGRFTKIDIGDATLLFRWIESINPEQVRAA